MHKELIDFTLTLVKNLVKEPDMVSVQEFSSDDEQIILEIIVQNDDMGSVIGRSGKMASAIRTLIQAYAYTHELPRIKINIDSF